MCVCYLRPRNVRPVWIGPRLGQVDWQGVIPRGWCSSCGSEVFLWGDMLCPRCKKEEMRNGCEEKSKSL